MNDEKEARSFFYIHHPLRNKIIKKNEKKAMRIKQCFGVEPGEITEMLGALIVMLFMFSLLLVLIGYIDIVQKKLDINNCAKEYLYVMEQYGYLPTQADKDAGVIRDSVPTMEELKSDLAKIGVTAEILEETNKGSLEQVAYGDTVRLVIEMKFSNPLCKYFGGSHSNQLFNILGLSNEINYTLSTKSTSKW